MNLLYRYMVYGIIIILISCVSIRQHRQLQNELLNLHTRVLKLEELGETSTPALATKIASLEADFEKIKIDIQKLRGEIDTLRVGIKTGQLPDAKEDESSIAKILDTISHRLDAIENTQNELLKTKQNLNIDEDNLQNQDITTNKDNISTTPNKISNITALRNAFNKKQYAAVIKNAPIVIKKYQSSKTKSEIDYLHAESLFKLGQIRDAALKYNELIEKYPKSTYIPHSLLRMGDCFRYLGDKSTAKIYYEELLTKHKKTTEAKTAKKRIIKYFESKTKPTTPKESNKQKKKNAKKNTTKKNTSVVKNKSTKNKL